MWPGSLSSGDRKPDFKASSALPSQMVPGKSLSPFEPQVVFSSTRAVV